MRTSKQLTIPDSDRRRLEAVAKNGNTPQKVALRVRIVLLSGDGVVTGGILQQLATTTPR